MRPPGMPEGEGDRLPRSAVPVQRGASCQPRLLVCPVRGSVAH